MVQNPRVFLSWVCLTVTKWCRNFFNNVYYYYQTMIPEYQFFNLIDFLIVNWSGWSTRSWIIFDRFSSIVELFLYLSNTVDFDKQSTLKAVCNILNIVVAEISLQNQKFNVCSLLCNIPHFRKSKRMGRGFYFSNLHIH